MDFKIFKGSLVKLRAIHDDDFETIASWYEDAYFLRNVDTAIALPKDIEEIKDMYEPDDSMIELMICPLENNFPVGFVSIYNIEWNNRSGTLAIGIGRESDRHLGYGTDTLKLIMKYAFNELNLDRLDLEVVDYNQDAYKLYEKLGFKLGGRRREAVLRDGKKFDVLFLDILCSEWIKK
ncbi:hypothetical protein FC19_GL000179 [Liquorilactobacillus aquaticus DSM 21051]|uniref:N-acetyltransferase domain-containing protein n=1 Tax=Liquorilactobacillus aquaticus DSM 21051 TaxID=1423725 RepID=A0A0R2CZD0_9LACO|nr:GNAT family protein [Liquorilactobacillus aquaticus]KRM97072.1 hypothetical protein FC19_GL000179 [Liquorilactobacillus aquaticus DSM 21051]